MSDNHPHKGKRETGIYQRLINVFAPRQIGDSSGACAVDLLFLCSTLKGYLTLKAAQWRSTYLLFSPKTSLGYEGLFWNLLGSFLYHPTQKMKVREWKTTELRVGGTRECNFLALCILRLFWLAQPVAPLSTPFTLSGMPSILHVPSRPRRRKGGGDPNQ